MTLHEMFTRRNIYLRLFSPPLPPPPLGDLGDGDGDAKILILGDGDGEYNSLFLDPAVDGRLPTDLGVPVGV